MLIIGEPDTSFPSIRIFGLPHHVQEVFKYIAKVMRIDRRRQGTDSPLSSQTRRQFLCSVLEALTWNPVLERDVSGSLQPVHESSYPSRPSAHVHVYTV